MVLKTDAAEISDTFGTSPGAKLVLGSGSDQAVLKVPEGALHQGMNITFKFDSRGKSGGGQLGKICRIEPVVPPSTTPEAAESAGPPFEVELPVGGRKGVNLAIGVDNDKGKVKWMIVAPKQIYDSGKIAMFELSTLPAGWIHLTTKPVTSPENK